MTPLAITQPDTEQLKQRIARFREVEQSIVQQVRRVIVGQEEVLEQVMIALFVGGHCLITGLPGTAKTLLVRTLAQTLGLVFKRIQFTPDLMPSDMTGTDIIEEDHATGRRSWTFVPGPVFANIILADEINRTTPKTQAALLECMEELQVTSDGVTHVLPRPFFVIATQNNIEHAGTYSLPEAQLDRFLMPFSYAYPLDANFFFEHKPSLDEQDLIHHWNDRRVSFLANLRYCVYSLTYWNGFDFDTLAGKIFVDERFTFAGMRCDTHPAGFSCFFANGQFLGEEPHTPLDAALRATVVDMGCLEDAAPAAAQTSRASSTMAPAM